MTETPTESPKRKKIDRETVLHMAKLCAKRIDEKGACLMLGLKPQTWYTWKGRKQNATKFVDILSQVREAKLNACIESIDEAGDGNPEKGHRPDWRAKAFLVERILAPERFGQNKVQEIAQGNQTLVVVSDSIASNVFAGLLGQGSRPKMVTDSAVKALPEANVSPQA